MCAERSPPRGEGSGDRRLVLDLTARLHVIQPSEALPPRRLRSAHKSMRGLKFGPMRTMAGGARCARGLETRGNDGFGEGSPEVRRRTALVGRAISE